MLRIKVNGFEMTSMSSYDLCLVRIVVTHILERELIMKSMVNPYKLYEKVWMDVSIMTIVVLGISCW